MSDITQAKQSYELSIMSFNVRGLKSTWKQHALSEDRKKYRISVGCLQETKVKLGDEQVYGDYRLILLPSECGHYGQGFVTHKHLSTCIHRCWRITNRISVLQINTGHKSGMLSIINVYAPQSGRIAKNLDELDSFYEELARTLTSLEDLSILFIAGDWNATVGIRSGDEQFIGRYGRGYRNLPGTLLAHFCETFSLFLCNTAFCHAARHRTTWTGSRTNGAGEPTSIYNQIDYILCRQTDKARTHGNSL
ncbi:craniofacial development protein 2-like [Octopus sinensis]|uniref:Craniofacial development protein 2-like n=1 Tax=Octopus sinensis TaxID=2607531 RepID=A0A6P7TVC3_9MOLL|nr:craniofacial development protein 2-like [Octopus sinensis]XP_029655728.1 craniofacial development protein 2-like [Octopus sinensis]